jgi:transposase
MEMIGKVRRLHHRQSKSVREIARITSLSRNTVRECLREPVAGEPKYRRGLRPGKLTIGASCWATAPSPCMSARAPA